MTTARDNLIEAMARTMDPLAFEGRDSAFLGRGDELGTRMHHRSNPAPDGLENRATPGPTYPNVAMSGP